MHRKLMSAITLAMLGLAFAFAPAQAAPRDLKMSIYVADHHWLVSNVFKPFAEDVAKFSNGDLKVTLYTGSVLGKAKEQLGLAEKGIADLAFIIPSYTRNRFPLTESGLLPFAFETATQATQVLGSLRTRYLDKEYTTVKLLAIAATSPSALVTTKKIASLDDMKGLNLRGAGGAQTAMLKEVGANVVSMPVSDAYLAFQRGALEGTIIPLASAPGYKFEEVIKFVNPINFSVTPLIIAANTAAWQSLSKDQQAALQKAADAAELNVGKGFDTQDNNGLQTMVKAGAEVTKLSAADKKRLHEISAPLWDEWKEKAASKGLPAEAFLADFHKAVETYAPK